MGFCAVFFLEVFCLSGFLVLPSSLFSGSVTGVSSLSEFSFSGSVCSIWICRWLYIVCDWSMHSFWIFLFLILFLHWNCGQFYLVCHGIIHFFWNFCFWIQLFDWNRGWFYFVCHRIIHFFLDFPFLDPTVPLELQVVLLCLSQDYPFFLDFPFLDLTVQHRIAGGSTISCAPISLLSIL